MSYPLGVDVGTTYTAAALWRDGRVQTVPLGNRANAVPSVTYLREDGTLLVGEAAVRRRIAEPDRAASEFKRRMGDEVPILLGGRGFAAHELTGHVLRWVVDRVSELQGGPPSHIVLTYPAEWGDYRRGLYLEAARTAGFGQVGLLAEPVAAATWYAAQERVEPGSLIGIYDFGGGTFDASVVRKTGTGVEIYGEPGGDDSIGGVDFDHALYRYVAESAGVDVGQLDMADRAVAGALAQLLASVVDVKEALSADVDAVVPVMLPGVTSQVLVTRADFETLIKPQVLGTVGVFGRVVRRAGVDPAALHAVLLVGGSSRIPLVRQLLAAELGIRVAVDAHPKYTVSLGAAIAAAPRVLAPPARPPFAGPHVTSPPGAGPWAPGPAGTGPRVTGPSGVAGPPSAGPPSAGPPGARPAAAGAPVAGSTGPQPAGPWAPATPPGGLPTSPSTPPGGSPVRLAPEPVSAPAPAIVEQVDLAQTGLTAPTDVPVVLPPISVVVAPPPGAPKQVVIRTRDPRAGSGAARSRLAAIGLLVLIVGVVATVAVVVLRARSDSSPPPSPGGSGASSIAVVPAVGTARLTGELVGAPDGADAMRAVAGLANGELVAVGVSLRLQPRAWVHPGGGPWTAVEVPAEEQGSVADVAATGNGLVAVGWTGTGAARRPAVWTSADGRAWRLLDPAGDFAAGTGVAELTAVTAAGGRLLATGIDRRSDPVDGDIAVFTSPDGLSWTKVPSTGLDGTGPQAVQRLTGTADGGLVAVGSALAGARRGPAVWTSADGVGWQLSPFAPEGSPTLWAVTQQPDGTLFACGSVGAADRPTVGCWRQQGQQRWQPWEATAESGSPTPLFIYGMLASGDTWIAVGAGQADATVDAAAWTARLDPR